MSLNYALLIVISFVFTTVTKVVKHLVESVQRIVKKIFEWNVATT